MHIVFQQTLHTVVQSFKDSEGTITHIGLFSYIDVDEHDILLTTCQQGLPDGLSGWEIVKKSALPSWIETHVENCVEQGFGTPIQTIEPTENSPMDII